MSKLRLSNSKITAYQQCPRRYRLRYVDRIETATPGFFLIGSAVHAGVEKLHLGGALPEALGAACLSVDASTSQPYDNSMTATDMKDLVKKLVTVYHDNATPWNVTKAEEEFVIEGANVVLTGTIDAILDNETRVGELKTSKKAWSQAQADLQLQATVYAYHLAFKHKIKTPIEVVYRVLIKPSKTYPAGNFQEVRTVRGPVHYGYLTQTITDVATAIQSGLFPRHISPACGWCEFRRTCIGEAYPQYAGSKENNDGE